MLSSISQSREKWTFCTGRPNTCTKNVLWIKSNLPVQKLDLEFDEGTRYNYQFTGNTEVRGTFKLLAWDAIGQNPDRGEMQITQFLQQINFMVQRHEDQGKVRDKENQEIYLLGQEYQKVLWDN